MSNRMSIPRPTRTPHILAALCLVLAPLASARADQQQIAPGTGKQNSVVIDTGANGLCETTAAAGDLQIATVGSGSPNRNEIRCGVNKIADTAATGDDVQLVAVGGACKNANTLIVDTGENGVPETVPGGDDVYSAGIVLGVPPSNAPCVIAGADGVAQTPAVVGDDTQLLLAGAAEINSAVVLCGPNLLADTAANNVEAGDDIQVVPVGNACAENDVVVDSGADGIATTQAEGPDLRIAAAKPIRVTVPSRAAFGSKLVKLKISNVEFGATAPASRTFTITTTPGSCPNGVVTQVDADPSTPGLQATATVDKGDTVSASLVAKVQLQTITTPSRKNAWRCAFDVTVVAVDSAPDADDGANTEGNTTTVDIEAFDVNDY